MAGDGKKFTGQLKPQNSIMPKVHASLGTLVIAMSVMCYLASLAIGGMLLINRAVDKWTSDISGEITVQVRPVDGVDLAAETAKAAKLLEQTAGISNVSVLSEEDAAKLLEPWLGRHSILDELPIPRLISAQTDKRSPPDLEQLARTVKAEIKGATLDTHRQWQDELTSTARTLRWLALVVLAIIAAASVALVTYASRAALETNREVLEVLYLVGARDRFIAKQVERRFFRAGFKAGLAGVIGGLATFALLYFSAHA
ncbi:MAG: ABC transporter permease, partial [Hyphomicrobiales bacterium]|nr:ABC transporter permease [Hyphomicrobiales bacterium]